MSKKKILIVRVNAIGDVVMTTVMAYAIKKKHPDYEIHYCTGGYCTELLGQCSYIDKVITYKDDTKEMAKLFRKEKYDVIFSLNYTFNNFLLALLSCPKKNCFKALTNKSWIENYFITAKKVFPDIELPKRLYLENNPEIEKEIDDLIKDCKRPYIVISPGKFNNQPREGRVWNIEKWRILSKKLKEIYGGTIFITGGYDEIDYHNKLNNEDVVMLSGRLDICKSSALLSKANLVISGDSGPIHIASAHNVKTLALLGSTSPDKIKPYGENGHYIEPLTKCKYCWEKKCKLGNYENYAPCIESITPEMVLEKIEKENLL